MTFSDVLKHYRIKRNYTQNYVSNYFNMSQSSYSRLERGITKAKQEHLVKFLELYDASPSNIYYILKNCK